MIGFYGPSAGDSRSKTVVDHRPRPYALVRIRKTATTTPKTAISIPPAPTNELNVSSITAGRAPACYLNLSPSSPKNTDQPGGDERVE